MSRKSVLVLAAVSTFATVLWFTGNAMALPGAPLASSGVPQIVGAPAPHEGSGVILVQIVRAPAVSGAAAVSGRPAAVTAATLTATTFTGTYRTAETRTSPRTGT